MKKISFLLFVASMLLYFGACTKEAGPTGPSGANGLNGKDGNANVYYSHWKYLSNSWRDTTIDATMMRYSTDSAYGITPAILDSGAVLAYMNYGTGTFPLPYISYAGGVGSSINFIPGKKNYYIHQSYV